MLTTLAVSLASILLQGPTAVPAGQHRDPGPVPGPYDFSGATGLLQAELGALNGNAAVLVRQGAREIYRFQAGSIDFDTQTRMASLTKSVSAGVILGLVEDGVLSLDEPVAESYPLLFPQPGIGVASVLDCWSMRHGIDSLLAYEHLPFYTHWQSVVQLGLEGFQVFPAGEQLGYDGAGMQISGHIAAERAGMSWEELSYQRMLEPLGMETTDYLQFAPNPCVPGGMRSTAFDVMRYADMILDEGLVGGQRVLQPESIERFFTNHTRGLPVQTTPFPPFHPDYPYGVDPDYAFGGWVLAEHPVSQHVEEIVGAGAWGSYVWIDRRRGLSAVLITDVPAGSQSSAGAALGLFSASRAAVEELQVQSLDASTIGPEVELTWTSPAGAKSVQIVGSREPILDVFDLRAALVLGTGQGGQLTVAPFPYYAATAAFGSLQNTALIPGENSIQGP